MTRLDERSRANLVGVHPDLVRVVERAAAASPVRFTVIEGMRTLARQRQLKARGASKTLNSRHLTGHAVDIVPLDDRGNVSWDWPLYHRLAPVIKDAARREGVPITWGGDWRSFKDGPHWELPWKQYPVRTASTGDMELMQALVEKPMGEVAGGLGSSRTMLGAGGAGAGGAALIGDSVHQLTQAESHFSAGNIFGLVIGSIVLLGAGLALYARWDDAGRPLPRFIERWVR